VFFCSVDAFIKSAALDMLGLACMCPRTTEENSHWVGPTAKWWQILLWAMDHRGANVWPPGSQPSP
jgi:hypothetical protein